MARKLYLVLVPAISVILAASGCDMSNSASEETINAPDSTTSAAPSTEAPQEPSPEVSQQRPPQAEAVVSSNERATDAGIDILAAGGSAADASAAVAAVLSVVEPYYSSVLGGGTWAL